MCFDTSYALLIAQKGSIACIKRKYVGEKLRKVRAGFEGAPIARFFQPNLLNLHSYNDKIR